MKLAFSSSSPWVRRMQVQLLVNGMQEAATMCVGESVRWPEVLRWPAFYKKHASKVRRGLDRPEQMADQLDGGLDYTAISTAVLYGFLDFRFADTDWRDGHPKLAAWYAVFAERPSMNASGFMLSLTAELPGERDHDWDACNR